MKKSILSILAAASSFVFVGCATHSSKDAHFDVVRAQRIELVDAQGQVRGVMEQDENGGTLRLMDSGGKLRASVSVDSDGPAVSLFAADETPKAIVNLGNDGHPGLSLRDGGGKVRYDLRLREDERPCMLYWDQRAPKPRMGVGINPQGNPNIVLFDADFNRRSWVQLLAEEGPQIGVGDEEGPVWTSPDAK